MGNNNKDEKLIFSSDKFFQNISKFISISLLSS